MATAKRKANNARRRLMALFAKGMDKEIAATEALIKAIADFGNNCIEGKIVTSKTVAVPMAVSILHMALPEILKNKQKTKKRYKRVVK